MKLTYSYVIDDGYYVGHLDDYPQYTTQGESLEDFEKSLREIYAWILDGTLDVRERKGFLEIAG
jgi:predicted RNase H-like HicB family nuclease